MRLSQDVPTCAVTAFVVSLLFLVMSLQAYAADALPLQRLRLPPGFKISVFADGLAGARSMTRSPSGKIYVGTRENQGPVYVVSDTNGDGKADKVNTLLKGLYYPNGVEFKDGALYVAEINRVLRYDDIEKNLQKPPAPKVVNDTLPDKTHHGQKYIRFGPDGRLYVPVGAPCNVCEQKDPRFATIMRMNQDGSNPEIFASGVRNTVGFDWHPATKELWFTDNGRDWLGDDRPPDELNKAPKGGMHFGFPYCHGGTISDPEFGKKKGCDQFTAPVQNLGPHVAALGMKFYTGTMFPAKYKNSIFICEHGSWNRSTPIGYRICVVSFDDQQRPKYETFIDGWRHSFGVWGRPVDVLQLPDGSLLVSDDHAGAIYRITYSGN